VNRKLKKFVIASIVVLVVWLFLMRSSLLPDRWKKLLTLGVIASPIPPIP
jgi:hypothetical protein